MVAFSKMYSVKPTDFKVASWKVALANVTGKAQNVVTQELTAISDDLTDVDADDKLAGDALQEVKRAMYYDYALIGLGCVPTKANKVLKILLKCGLKDLEGLAKLYGDNLASLGLPQSEVTKILELRRLVKEYEDEEKKVQARSSKNEPIRKIDLAARLKELGVDGCDENTNPDSDCVRVLLLKQEGTRSGMPLLELKQSPWLPSLWTNIDDVEADTERIAELTQDRESSEKAAKALAIEKAASSKKKKLPWHHHSTMLLR